MTKKSHQFGYSFWNTLQSQNFPELCKLRPPAPPAPGLPARESAATPLWAKASGSGPLAWCLKELNGGSLFLLVRGGSWDYFVCQASKAPESHLRKPPLYLSAPYWKEMDFSLISPFYWQKAPEALSLLSWHRWGLRSAKCLWKETRGYRTERSPRLPGSSKRCVGSHLPCPWLVHGMAVLMQAAASPCETVRPVLEANVEIQFLCLPFTLSLPQPSSFQVWLCHTHK